MKTAWNSLTIKEYGDIMKEDSRQRERRLRKELAAVKAVNRNKDSRIKKERNLDIAGVPMDTSHKPVPANNDIPDVISLPPKRRGRKENIPF